MNGMCVSIDELAPQTSVTHIESTRLQYVHWAVIIWRFVHLNSRQFFIASHGIWSTHQKTSTMATTSNQSLQNTSQRICTQPHTNKQESEPLIKDKSSRYDTKLARPL